MQSKTELLDKIQEKEDRVFLASVYDKLEQSDRKNYPVFSDFLDARQIVLVQSVFPFWRDRIRFFGGIRNAERQICYLEFGYEDFPVRLLEIFSSQMDKITHGDVLGSLMGLGMKRQKIGDILTGERLIVAVKEEVAEYICMELSQISRYPVTVKILDDFTVERKQQFSARSTTVSSLRLDCLVADIAHLSREKAKSYIIAGKVKVNHFEETNYKHLLCEGDVLSLSHVGRFLLDTVDGFTKKDRVKITIKKYE
ncbi:MAG: hypothetical protein IJ278_03940 [Clostridia bacterium]|nr:hypothetical protein [Clostridia bacterium]